MRRHDTPLLVTKKEATKSSSLKQNEENEELYSNALILTMIRDKEQIKSWERAVKRIPSTSSESKADVRGTHQSLDERMMFESSFIKTIPRGTKMIKY